jgi:hypothetical protein
LEIPYLTGHWIFDVKDAVLVKDDKSGEYTHHEGKISSITSQQKSSDREAI